MSGNNLTLSLDIKLQEVAEQAFGERRGALVAIEPATGGVLAFVSKPGFDPNLFVDGIDPQNWEELNDSPDQPLLNRALRGTYPPGSTFKPFMALAALTYGKRTPQQTIYDPGYFKFGGHALPRRQGRRPRHGRHVQVDRGVLRHLLLHARQRPRHRRHRALHAASSASARRPASTSRARRPACCRRRNGSCKRFRRPEQQKWYAGDTISLGIGQGYNAFTPLQLAQAIATLANDGVMYRPHLVNYIENIAHRRTARAIEPRAGAHASR